MKNFIVIGLLFAALSAALAVNVGRRQASLIALKTEVSASKTDFSDFITGLLELHSADIGDWSQNEPAEPTDNSEVIEVFQQLRTELEGLKDREQGLWDQARQDYTYEKAALEGNIDQLTSGLNHYQLFLSDRQNALDSAQQSLSNSVQQLETDQQQLAEIEAARQVDHDNYLQKVATIAESLDAIDEAVRIVNEINDQDLTTTGFTDGGSQTALLQVSTNKLQATFTRLHKSLSKSRSSSIAPFITELAQVLSKGVNEAVIRNILDLLAGLRTTLEEERASDEQTENEQVEVYQNVKGILTGTIQYLQAQIFDLQGQISNLQDVIVQIEAAIAGIQAQLSQLTEQLNTLEANWEQTDARYAQQVGRLQADIDLCTLCISKLNQAQDGGIIKVEPKIYAL